MAGERFCVRNSGVHAVIESVGDHGCEYMTGGRAVILGSTGRNFAAGMSGGIAYVLDENGDFSNYCNTETVDLVALDDKNEIKVLETMIRKHANYTQSERAWKILAFWEEMVPNFVKVFPRDYRRMLEAMKRAEESGLTGDSAAMMAFEENKSDMARVSGN